MDQNDSVAPEQSRHRNLDNILIVGAVYVLSMAILLAGELFSSVQYTDPMFVIEYFTAEILVAGLFVFASFFLFDRSSIGLKKPVFTNIKQALPLLVVTLAGMAPWIISLITLPEGVKYDIASALLVLRTTLTVGFTEEWMYRGLLLVFFTRKFGLRKGAFTAMLFFGILHLLNIAGGVTVSSVIFQFFNTMLIGSVFIIAAIATRSLVIPMICHGLYDFFVIETSKLTAAGAFHESSFITVLVSIPVGIYAVTRVAKLSGSDPYAPVTTAE